MQDRLCVIGVGYVGLPLATSFASAGFKVTGLDVNPETVDRINRGEIDTAEPELRDMVRRVVKSGNLKVTLKADEACRGAPVKIVCVQTPVDKRRKPYLASLKSALKHVRQSLKKGDMIIIESTIPPGTMENFVKPYLEETGMKVGRDIFLAYCCENVFPSNILQETMHNSKIVGGLDDKSIRMAVELYSRINNGQILTTDTKTAEIVKIAENVFRDTNIALANELAIICKEIHVDVHKVIQLANRNPRVHLHSPGCGVGGSCLPKDPYFLIDAARLRGVDARLIETAREVNNSMPRYTVGLIKKALKAIGKKPSEAIVTILGVTYKGDVNDTRISPAEEIIRRLLTSVKEVRVHDVFSKETFGGKGFNDLMPAVKGSDCVVILANHSTYRQTDFREVKRAMSNPSAIVDTPNIVNVEARGAGYFSI